MSRLVEKTPDELCINTIETVDRIMGRYGAGLEEACAIAGINALDYSDWKESMENAEAQKQEETPQDKEALARKEKALGEIVMHKIPDLLKLGITLESACDFARITVDEYEAYKKSH